MNSVNLCDNFISAGKHYTLGARINFQPPDDIQLRVIL